MAEKKKKKEKALPLSAADQGEASVQYHDAMDEMMAEVFDETEEERKARKMHKAKRKSLLDRLKGISF